MNKTTVQNKIAGYVICVLGCLFMASCGSGRKAAQQPAAVNAGARSVLLAEVDKGWLKYRIYQNTDTVAIKGDQILRLSIRIINTSDNTSPLRKLCSNLTDYNTYYEYLLNSAKNELVLSDAKAVFNYPVAYSFENNYDAFPFETINVGYRITRKTIPQKLIYTDRVFARDTITFFIHPSQNI